MFGIVRYRLLDLAFCSREEIVVALVLSLHSFVGWFESSRPNASLVGLEDSNHPTLQVDIYGPESERRSNTRLDGRLAGGLWDKGGFTTRGEPSRGHGCRARDPPRQGHG